MHAHQPLSLLTKLKKQNNKIGAFHSNTKPFGKKRSSPRSMHASQEHHTIYAANVSSKKDCNHCSSWFGAGALPLSHGKSPRELLATGGGGQLSLATCQEVAKHA